MRKFIFLGLFLVFSAGAASAQNGGNGYGWGNSSGSYNPWANGNWPQFVINWLQNGGQVPMPLAVVAIREARDWGMATLGLTQGQMLVKYLSGQLTIEYVPTAPPTLTFRITYGGNIAIVLLQDL